MFFEQRYNLVGKVPQSLSAETRGTMGIKRWDSKSIGKIVLEEKGERFESEQFSKYPRHQ